MLDSGLNSTLKMRGSSVVEQARRPKKKRNNKSGVGAGMLKKPKSARQWRYLHPRSASAQFEPRLRRTIVQADAQKKLRSWSSWSDAHSSSVRPTCRSSRSRNGGSWKRRNEILNKFEIVQCSPNWGERLHQPDHLELCPWAAREG